MLLMTTNYENLLWKESLYVVPGFWSEVHMLFVNTFGKKIVENKVNFSIDFM